MRMVDLRDVGTLVGYFVGLALITSAALVALSLVVLAGKYFLRALGFGG